MKMSTLAVIALSLALAGEPARADDGRIEINQARALAGGVTPGDFPGFPVTLSLPGSYVLTSNLVVTSPGVDGIRATEAGPDASITIDLNGFEVAGPVTCTGLGSTMDCGTGSGFGWGISGYQVTVLDGRIRGFEYGIYLGERARIQRVVVESNRVLGIEVGGGSIVSETIAFQNGGNGIFVPFDVQGSAIIEKSVSSSNRELGFYGSVVGCVAENNGDSGIAGGDANVVRDSTAYLNEVVGIIVYRSGVVSDNAAYENGGAGIGAGEGTSVQRNTMASNGGYGLILTADSTYTENTIGGNGAGTATGGVNLGSNSCNGSATCP